MGNNQPNTIRKPVTKAQLDIVLSKVQQYIMLERNRKVEMLMKQEKVLIEMAKRPHIEITELRTKAISNINLLKWIQGANIVLNYAKTLGNYTMALERGQYNYDEMKELIPAVNTLIWSTNKLNLSAIVEFNILCQTHFGPSLLENARAGNLVDEKLKRNFSGLIPTVFEIDDYLKDLFNRFTNDIDKPTRDQLMNSIIDHNKNFGGKFGAPPSNYDPSIAGNTTINPQDQTTIMSQLPEPIPGPQFNSGTTGGNNSNATGGNNSNVPGGGYSGLPDFNTSNNQGGLDTKIITSQKANEEDDIFYSQLKGLQLSEVNNSQEPVPTPGSNVSNKKSSLLNSVLIPGTGLPGTGVNEPSEEQTPFDFTKSNIDYGCPAPVIVPNNNNPFESNNISPNDALVSGLNMGEDFNKLASKPDPNMVNFGNTDFTNSGFSNQNTQSNLNMQSQNVVGSNIDLQSKDFSKHHTEQPKSFEKNPIGDYGQDFPKAPEFNLGGKYDWNFYPKLVNLDLDGKLALLRKVGV